MNKKFKYTSLVAAGAVTLGLVGGTLAWFTSTDVATNKFATGESEVVGEEIKGIDVIENFEVEDAKEFMPGDEINKQVQVVNTASYPQFVRVQLNLANTQNVTGWKVVTNSTNQKQQIVLYNEGGNLDKISVNLSDYVHLSLPDNADDLQAGHWYYDGGENGSGYFYYIGSVPGKADYSKNWTNSLLNNLTMATDAEEKYVNLKFDLVVNALSVQATNDAFKAKFNSEGYELSQVLDTKYDALEDQTPTSPNENKLDPITEDSNGKK